MQNQIYQDIICFSSAYWDEALWTNKQHIMSRLSKSHRVLYIEPGIFSKRYFTQNTLRRPLRWFKWLRRENENLWIYSPLILFYRGSPWLRDIGWRILLSFVRRFVSKQHFQSPLLWIYQPEAVRSVGELAANLVLYDCVDEISNFPYYLKNIQHQQSVLKDENSLLSKADLVVTTAQTLYEAKRHKNPNTHLVHNVADVEHFSTALCTETIIPADIACLKGPRIGFIGAVSEYKVNFELIKHISQVHPEWHIVLIGPVGEGDLQTQVTILHGLPNVHLLGHRPYAVLPAYIKGFDVCIIPYNLNEYTAGVFPMKFFEFLGTGKPVVSTKLPSLQGYEFIAAFADNNQKFVALIESALQNDNDAEKARRIEIAQQNSWDQRIGKIMELVTQIQERKQK